jgi:hypothetical protein
MPSNEHAPAVRSHHVNGMGFPWFARLPLELQDRVWEFAIPPTTPSALFADLKMDKLIIHTLDSDILRCFANSQKLVVRLDYTCPPEDRLHSISDDLTSILRTTRRSRAAARRLLDSKQRTSAVTAFEAAEQGNLRLLRRNISLGGVRVRDPRLSLQSHYQLPKRPANPDGTSLVLLNYNWNEECPFLYTPFGERRRILLAPRQQPRYMAVPWTLPARHERKLDGDPPGLLQTVAAPRRLCRGLAGILVAYPHLEVLYVLVTPELVQRAQDRPWRQQDVWTNESGDGPSLPTSSLESYLAGSYGEEPSHCPGPFWCSWREYFEIPPEQVVRLGGLEGMIREMESLRVVMAERQWETTPVRLMSWRDR